MGAWTGRQSPHRNDGREEALVSRWLGAGGRLRKNQGRPPARPETGSQPTSSRHDAGLSPRPGGINTSTMQSSIRFHSIAAASVLAIFGLSPQAQTVQIAIAGPMSASVAQYRDILKAGVLT